MVYYHDYIIWSFFFHFLLSHNLHSRIRFIVRKIVSVGYMAQVPTLPAALKLWATTWPDTNSLPFHKSQNNEFSTNFAIIYCEWISMLTVICLSDNWYTIYNVVHFVISTTTADPKIRMQSKIYVFFVVELCVVVYMGIKLAINCNGKFLSVFVVIARVKWVDKNCNSDPQQMYKIVKQTHSAEEWREKRKKNE